MVWTSFPVGFSSERRVRASDIARVNRDAMTTNNGVNAITVDDDKLLYCVF